MASTRDYTKPDSKINAFKDEYSDIDVMFVAHPISGDIAIKKDSDAIKRIRQTRKIREKGESTTNPHEKDTFLKRGGPIMPNFKKVQRKTKKRYG